jgi:hypothetical protein
MAWVVVPGTNGVWEYDNAATRADTYSDSPGTISGGIRSFALPGGNVRETYIKCRKTSNPPGVGELDKTYYDAQV